MARGWLAIGLTLFAATNAGAKLELRSIEPAYGLLWPAKKTLVYFPVDTLCFRYYVAGAQVGGDGLTDVETTIQIRNKAGSLVLFKPYQPARLPLGKTAVPFRGHFSERLDGNLPPGVYTLTVEVTDNVARDKVEFSRELTVKPAEFAVASVGFFHDEGHSSPAPAAVAVAEDVRIRLYFAGLQAKDGQIDVDMTADLVDPTGVVLISTKQPVQNKFPPGSTVWCDLNLSGTCSPGDWTARCKFTDRMTGKTIAHEVPFRVIEP